MSRCKSIVICCICYICVLMTAVAIVSGFEFFDTISPSITADPIEVIIWVKPGVTPANEARVLADIREGLKMWENIPTSCLRFEIVSVIHSATLPAKQSHQLRITIGNGNDLTTGGASYPHNGNPGEWFGVVADAPQVKTPAVTAHEVGHALGFIHSTITGRVFPIDQCPIMHWRVASLFPLQDDIAGLSTAYPNPDLPLFYVTGRIKGRLIATNCNDPIFGINVIAVNTATGIPAVSRISGYAGNPGTFELVGLPVGNYQIHFLDGHSMRGSYVRKNMPDFYVSIQADNFTTFNSSPIFVPNAGYEFNMGDIPITIFPISIDGYYLGPVDKYDIDIPLTPVTLPNFFNLPQAAGQYEVWLHVQGGLRPLSAQISGLPQGLTGEITGDPRGHNSAVHGSHYIHIYGTPSQLGEFTIAIQITDLCGQSQNFTAYLSSYLPDDDNDGAPDMYDCDPLNPYLTWDLDTDTICEEISLASLGQCLSACAQGHTVYTEDECIWRCQHEDNCPCLDQSTCPTDSDYNRGAIAYESYCLPYKDCIQNMMNTNCSTMEEADYCHLYFANTGQYDGNENNRGDHCESCLQAHITSVRERINFDMNHGGFRLIYGPHEINILLEGGWLDILPPITQPYPVFEWNQVPQRVTVGYCACDENEVSPDGFCDESVCPQDQEIMNNELVWRPIYSNEALNKPNVGEGTACSNCPKYIDQNLEPTEYNNQEYKKYGINKYLYFSHEYGANEHYFSWCPPSELSNKYIQFRIAWQDPVLNSYTYYNQPDYTVSFYPAQQLNQCSFLGISIPQEVNAMYQGSMIKLYYLAQLTWQEGPIGPIDPSPYVFFPDVGVFFGGMYGFGGLYGMLGIGSLNSMGMYGFGGLYNMGMYGLSGLYSIGMYGPGGIYGLGNILGLGGLYGMGLGLGGLNSMGMYGLGGIYGLGNILGLGGLYGMGLGLGGLYDIGMYGLGAPATSLTTAVTTTALTTGITDIATATDLDFVLF